MPQINEISWFFNVVPMILIFSSFTIKNFLFSVTPFNKSPKLVRFYVYKKLI